MSMKHVVGYLFGIVASAAAAGAAYYFGVKKGQEQVVGQVNYIREQCKQNPDLDLDDALEAQLTDEKGDYAMDQADKNEVLDGALMAAGVGLGMAGFTSMVLAAGVNHGWESTMAEVKTNFNAYFDQVVDQSINSYNMIVDQGQRIGSAADILPDGAEKDAMEAYYGGLLYGKYAMMQGIEGWMMKEGYVREAKPGDKTHY